MLPNLIGAREGGKTWGRLSVLLVVLGVPGNAHGTSTPAPLWSSDGHRIVCSIAWQRLTVEARRGVTDLLGPETDGDTFADACVWADEIRSQLSGGSAEQERLGRFSPAHYVNFPRNAARVGRADCDSGAGARLCVLTGIDQVLGVLEGEGSDLSRSEGLKFLIHFVGDLHQPLHAGYGDDRGGNDRAVNVMGRGGWNIHAVWDRFFIDHRGESWRAMANRLSGTIVPISETEWSSLDPVVWANESYEIVESQVYRELERTGGFVGQVYYDRSVLTVERRLQMAGVRLAAVLNGLFGSGA